MNQPAPRPARPGAVTASSLLIYLYALTQVVFLVLAVPAMNAVNDAVKQVGVGMEHLYTPAAFASAGCTIVLVLVVVVLAIFNGRGSNGARITTWIFVGLLSCCGSTTLANTVGGGVGPVTVSVSVNGQQQVTDPLADVMPWYVPVSIALTAIGLVALLAAAILLATPAANRFFRNPAAAPPMPGHPMGGQYPGHPQPGPAAPGYPPVQGQPGYPPAQGGPVQGQPGYPPAQGRPAPGYPPAQGQPGYPQVQPPQGPWGGPGGPQ